MKRVLAGIGWFLVLWFGALMLGGMIVGSFAGAGQPTMTVAEGYQAGQAAGQAFGQQYGGPILILALLGSIVGTSFGWLPGTKRKSATA